MKLKNKYITGTQVMFYEIEMLPDYIDGILNTHHGIENLENLSYHFTFNLSEEFESIDTSMMSKDNLLYQFNRQIDRLKKTGVNVITTTNPREVYSMPDYRRDFNYNHCMDHDILIWGETDCYMPRETYHVLEMLHEHSTKNGIWKYITTFAIRKMWDASWKPLEHVDFENAKYYEKTEDKCFTEQSSIRYVMSIDEMNEINSRQEGITVNTINVPRFDGSGLVISSELIKAGANIPLAAFGLASDDTFMMTACQKTMGNQYQQYIIKNILKVHNREHPKKRNYAIKNPAHADEVDEESQQADKGDWYKIVRNTNEQNLQLYANVNQQRFFNYKDCLNQKKL